jgi:MerR family redox-sensitive transcriptional activator SoxR
MHAMPQESLSVGTVANRCGVKVSTLHFYESKGLIQSVRNAGNQRRYTKDVLRRISVIKAAQKMGITLAEIAAQFRALPKGKALTQKDWEKLSRRWQKSLNDRISYMKRLRDYMSGCIGCGCLSMDSCPLYNDNDKLSADGSGPVLLDNNFQIK